MKNELANAKVTRSNMDCVSGTLIYINLKEFELADYATGIFCVLNPVKDGYGNIVSSSNYGSVSCISKYDIELL